MNARFIMFSPQ